MQRNSYEKSLNPRKMGKKKRRERDTKEKKREIEHGSVGGKKTKDRLVSKE